MAHDLHLSSQDYSIALIVFFISYTLFEIPSNMILCRSKPSVYLPGIMFAWGGLTIAMAYTPTYHGLVGFRFAIGALESGFAPGMLLIFSSWYRPEEQSKRFAIYISAAILSGAFGGALAGAITANLDNTRGIAGSTTMIAALVSYVVLPDFPWSVSEQRFSSSEKKLAIERLRRHDTVENGNDPDVCCSLKMALANKLTWILVFGFMCVIGSLTLQYFFPTLVEGLGYSGTMANYMTVPIYAVSFLSTLIVGYLADRIPSQRGNILAILLATATVSSVVICLVYDFIARYVLLVVTGSVLWSADALALSYASSSLAHLPLSARAVALAFINAMGNLAQIYGAYLFPLSDKPKYIMGFGSITGMCLVGAVVFIFLHATIRKRGQGETANDDTRE